MQSREPRTNVVLPARVRWDGRWISATARNLSPHGLMLCAALTPPPGTYVEIQLLQHFITARTVWRDQQNCGFLARERLNVSLLLANRGAGGGPAVSLRARGGDLKHVPRRATAVDMAERSRWISSMTQFATIACVSLSAAGSLAWEAYHILAAPTAAIAVNLPGGGPQ